MGKMTFFNGLFKAKRRHVSVNHYLTGRLGIGNPWLIKNWLYGSSIESNETVE